MFQFVCKCTYIDQKVLTIIYVNFFHLQLDNVALQLYEGNDSCLYMDSDSSFLQHEEKFEDFLPMYVLIYSIFEFGLYQLDRISFFIAHFSGRPHSYHDSGLRSQIEQKHLE